MWTFDYSTGFVAKDAQIIDRDSYSGRWPDGFNNYLMQHVHDVGPLPLGFWTISGPPFNDAEHGDYILRLDPDRNTDVFGRSGFLWHGKPLPPRDIRTGSKGCLCSAYQTRMRVYQSGDTRLLVVSGLPMSQEAQL